MANVGYKRVSTAHQNPDRQLMDVKLDIVFVEYKSGKTTKRPELQNCIKYMREGDRLHVHSMDRLARNLRDLQKIIDTITQKGVVIEFYKESLVFSNEGHHLSRLLMQVMGAVAEFEAEIIRERIIEGVASAQKKGVHFGRSRALPDEKMPEVLSLIHSGMPKTKIAKKMEVSRATLYNALNRYQKKYELGVISEDMK